MTYSIVARDPETGELAVAVQSHFFSVGRVCPWARAGIGAVATQSMVDPAYGPLALDLLAAGKSPQDALRGLTASDAAEASRQVAVIDASGAVAAHTGTGCIPDAGHHVGENYSVQANMMRNPTVWDAMASAFESAEGDLVDRILAAFDAAEAEGGDIRGRQSAALLVVGGERNSVPGLDRTWDLRVEDHAEPVEELRRLVRLKRAYEVTRRAHDLDEAVREFDELDRVNRANPELAFWTGVALASAGQVDQARQFLDRAFAAHDGWAELLRRLRTVGRFPDDDELLAQLLPPT